MTRMGLTAETGHVSESAVGRIGTSGDDAWSWDARLELVIREPDLVQPAFQPIFDLERGLICGYEALARFQVSPRRSPLAWLQAAVERELQEPLEAALLEAGLRARARLPENCFLTVNVSPALLGSDAVQSVIERAGRLDAVVIELTERDEVDDYDRLDAALQELRQLGATVAVDDAGAGYASLQHIMRLRPEFIKLDRELVCGLHADPAKLALVEAVGAFAARIDSWVVAEGIERREELDAVRSIEVPLGQGFGLGTPRVLIGEDAAELEARVRPAAPTGASSLAAILTSPRPLRETELGLAAERFASDPTVEFLVVVDGYERPCGLLRRERRDSDGPDVLLAPMRIMLSETPDAVARRAMTRKYGQRFDPLVACDERGRYVGLLSTDQLVHLLSRIVNERTQP
jgi:EAL domain-containing protein (putative c-di-GMP-specific phosphodiesterase class I)